MRKWIAIFLLIAMNAVTSPVFAERLIEVYCQALENDPTFKAEYADLLTTRENVPISRAPLLPRINFFGDVQRQHIKADGLVSLPVSDVSQGGTTGIFADGSEDPFYNNYVRFVVSASQPLFNYAAWARLQTAKAEAKEAEAKFCAAAQDLIIRVAEAYFEVMKANSDLYYTTAQRRAIGEQVKENRARFKAGVISITSVYEAEASYDNILVRKEKAELALISREEDLRKITNHLYCVLHGINYLPLIEPDPKCSDAWVDLTVRQNYALKAANFATLAARENIKIEFGGHLPVVSATSEYRYNYDSNPRGTGQLLRLKQASIGLNVRGSIYQGGEVNARTFQAQYLFQKATQEQCFTYHEVISDARKAYHGIISGIKQIRAGKIAIDKGRESLKATKASYKLGTRTILDVINVQNVLYETYRVFVRDQYDYLLQMLLLKRAAGTLSVTDLQYIDCWLQRPVVLPPIDEGCCEVPLTLPCPPLHVWGRG